MGTQRHYNKFGVFLVLSCALQCNALLNPRLRTLANSCPTTHLRYKGTSNDNDNDVETQQAEEAPLSLIQQAEALRQEALSIEKALEEQRIQKQEKENAKIDGWIHDLFVQYEVNENTQMLNSVDQVFERLKDDRYSQEQVDKIFNRICETGPAQSRSNCSPIMTLLVDAAGKLDSVERVDNPNKRWSGKVERILRKRLFAMDWGFKLEEEDDKDNPWKL